MLAERHFPGILSTLRAEYRTRKGMISKDDSAFVNTMKLFARTIMETLLTTIINPMEVLILWDLVFEHGFEVLFKFGLYFLSKYERLIKGLIREEAKKMMMGINVDVL